MVDAFVGGALGGALVALVYGVCVEKIRRRRPRPVSPTFAPLERAAPIYYDPDKDIPREGKCVVWWDGEQRYVEADLDDSKVRDRFLMLYAQNHRVELWHDGLRRDWRPR